MGILTIKSIAFTKLDLIKTNSLIHSLLIAADKLIAMIKDAEMNVKVILIVIIIINCNLYDSDYIISTYIY